MMTARELITVLEKLIENDPQMYGAIKVWIRPDLDGPTWQSIDAVDTDEGEFVLYCS